MKTFCTAHVLAALLTLSGSGGVSAQIFGGTEAGGTVVLSNFENDLTTHVIVEAPPSDLSAPAAAAPAPKAVPAPPVATKAVPAVPVRLKRLIVEAARTHGVPAALLAAVAAVESGFDPRAVSVKGAAGLMQLLPATARRFDVADRFVPEQSLHGGAGYLRWLHRHFDGDLVRVIAAYNAGEGAVAAADGVPPFEETRQYVPRVLELLAAYTPLFAR